MKKILVIDDDLDICLLLKRFLEKNDFKVETTHDSKNALTLIKQNKYDLILCDYRLPKITGTQMLEEIREINPYVPVIIITGYGDVRIAVSILKKGAFDYVVKPLLPDEILATVKRALEQEPKQAPKIATTTATQQQTQSKPRLQKKDYVVGKSKQAELVQKHIALIAPTNMSVIILGETGTGKEFVANAIHQNSKRSGQPFVAIDCGALPKELAGSELFGHVKGAFTGALTNKKGSFEMANGGTIFLDEIGNLSYDNQIKLLRVLQERKVKPIGANQDIDIDVRVIVATNDQLRANINKGTFREDLYYRLNEFKIELTPLRERKEDVLFFAEHFLVLANQELEKEVTTFSEEAKEILENYYWHGNLRELGNVIKRAVLLAPHHTIEAICLPIEIRNPSNLDTFQESLSETDSTYITDLKVVAEQAEKKAILKVLEQTNYNKSKTAQILNIDRKTLYNKLKSLDISA